jgi:hypothetical protein
MLTREQMDGVCEVIAAARARWRRNDTFGTGYGGNTPGRRKELAERRE